MYMSERYDICMIRCDAQRWNTWNESSYAIRQPTRCRIRIVLSHCDILPLCSGKF